MQSCFCMAFQHSPLLLQLLSGHCPERGEEKYKLDACILCQLGINCGMNRKVIVSRSTDLVMGRCLIFLSWAASIQNEC